MSRPHKYENAIEIRKSTEANQQWTVDQDQQITSTLKNATDSIKLNHQIEVIEK